PKTLNSATIKAPTAINSLLIAILPTPSAVGVGRKSISKEFIAVGALIVALLSVLGADNVEHLIRTARFAF
ncbi:MAG: hypothetical protein AAFQ09_11615, partial [Pseudomonadota bacterium]